MTGGGKVRWDSCSVGFHVNLIVRVDPSPTVVECASNKNHNRHISIND
jgi:hypothetical protein